MYSLLTSLTVDKIDAHMRILDEGDDLSFAVAVGQFPRGNDEITTFLGRECVRKKADRTLPSRLAHFRIPAASLSSALRERLASTLLLKGASREGGDKPPGLADQNHLGYDFARMIHQYGF